MGWGASDERGALTASREEAGGRPRRPGDWDCPECGNVVLHFKAFCGFKLSNSFGRVCGAINPAVDAEMHRESLRDRDGKGQAYHHEYYRWGVRVRDIKGLHVCSFYPRGTCKYGDECMNLHAVPAANGTGSAPCIPLGQKQQQESGGGERDRVRERERDNDLRSTGAIVIHVSWEIAMDLDKFAHTLLGAFPPHVLRTLRPHSELRRHWRR